MILLGPRSAGSVERGNQEERRGHGSENNNSLICYVGGGIACGSQRKVERGRKKCPGGFQGENGKHADQKK